MKEDTIIVKIWRVIYPVILYFVLNLFVAFIVTTVLGMIPSTEPLQDRVNDHAAFTSIIHMAISLIVFYVIYKKDYVVSSKLLIKKAYYIPALIIMGVLASHGLSTLVSFLNIDGLLGSYAQIESSVFSADAVPVIAQTVIFAPMAEELVFRGMVYRRLKEYTNFWIAALVSSAIFGFYHFNLAQGIFAFIYGILLCAVYEKMHNLWSNIAVHFGGNLISVILVYTGLTLPNMWMYAIDMVIVLAAAWIIFHFIIRKAE